MAPLRGQRFMASMLVILGRCFRPIALAFAKPWPPCYTAVAVKSDL